MESITLLTAFYYLGAKKSFNPVNIFIFYMIATSLIVLSIFYWKIFPVCYVDGLGLTAFEKNSEYLICTILIISTGLLYKKRINFERRVYLIEAYIEKHSEATLSHSICKDCAEKHYPGYDVYDE